MSTSAYTSVEPLIALLHDDDMDVQHYAIDLLNSHAHQFWSQLAPNVDYIQKLIQQQEQNNNTHSTGVAEGELSFVQKAHLICSKLFYHMGKHSEALHSVLQSHYLPSIVSHFNPSDVVMGDVPSHTTPAVDDNHEYNQAMIALAIQTYIEHQRATYLCNVAKNNEKNNLCFAMDFDDAASLDDAERQTTAATTPPAAIDGRIEKIVYLLVKCSVKKQQYSTTIGLTIDALRLDWLKEILLNAPAEVIPGLMKETFNIAITIVDIQAFRQELLSLLTELYQTPPSNASGEVNTVSTTTTTAAKSTTTTTTTTTTTDDNMLRPSNSTPLHVVSDILALCQCFLALGDHEQVAKVLTQLASSENTTDHLLAYQVAYDLTQNQQIAFTSHVAAHFAQSADALTSTTTTTTTTTTASAASPTTTATKSGTAKITKGDEGNKLPGQRLKKIDPLKPSLPTVEPCGIQPQVVQKKVVPSTNPTTNNNSTTSEEDNKDKPTSDEATIAAETPTTTTTTTQQKEEEEEKAEKKEEEEEEEAKQIELTPAQQQQIIYKNLYNILTGQSTSILTNHFLYNNAQSNDAWFKALSRHPDFQQDKALAAALYAGYGIAQCGTHRDDFLRQTWSNFDTLDEWSEFTARASVGNLYRGQFDQIREILYPFLPQPGSIKPTPALPADGLGNYSQGGSLYAVGLAAAGVSNGHVKYLMEVLAKAKAKNDEALQSGAVLALGLCAVGSGDLEVFEELREMVWGDQPIPGLCAGIAIGLLNIGLYHTPDVTALIRELLPTTHTIEHQQIRHGLGLGLALMFFNAQQDAEGMIECLRASSQQGNANKQNSSQYDRWLSCWVDAMAYIGTGSNQVIKRLLELAITDPDVDVKRTAILAIAFVMLNEPERCMEVLEPLSTSYNEHIRYGVAMAIGIVCSSSSGVSPQTYTTVVKQGIALLAPLLKDKNDIVRQGALIANAMCLQQTASNTKYRECVESIQDCFQVDKSRSHRAAAAGGVRATPAQRVGGALAAGILHAGGMNSNIRLIAPIGNQKRTIAIAGMMLFTNYWYWYPLANMFSLTLSPTGVIGTYFEADNLCVPTDLKFVVKVPRVAMAYGTRESDELVKKTTKQVVNTLSKKAKKSTTTTTSPDTPNQSGKNVSGAGSNNSSSTNLQRSNSLGVPQLKLFASELIRQNSSIKKDGAADGGDKKDDKDDAATTTTTTATATTDKAKTEHVEPTVLQESKSTLAQKQKQRDERLPITVVSNNMRVLPRHIPYISCPKDQQFAPLKDRLFGIVLLQKTNNNKTATTTETTANSTTTTAPFVPITPGPGDEVHPGEPQIPAAFKLNF